MLDVKRKAEASHGAQTASTRLYTRPVSTSDVDPTNTRKVPVAQATRRSGGAPQAVSFQEFRGKVPVLLGEFHCRGIIAVDGVMSGQLETSNSCLSLKQRSNGSFGSSPELDGEISFKDMVRVNGHIAGKVCSEKGTLIVDILATVDASIDVSVAVISGTVNGDVIARDRVEIGPAARIPGQYFHSVNYDKGWSDFRRRLQDAQTELTEQSA